MFKKVLSNEFMKTLKSRALIAIIIIYILYSALTVYAYKDSLAQGKIDSMGFSDFIFYAASDFAVKPVLPLMIIFLNLLLSNVFFDAKEGNSLKFELIRVDDRKRYFAAKIVFSLIFYLLFAVFLLLSNIILAAVFFNSPGTHTVGEAATLYFMNILPGSAQLFFMLFLLAAFKIKQAATIRVMTVLNAIILSVASGVISFDKYLPIYSSKIINEVIMHKNFSGSALNQAVSLFWLILFALLLLKKRKAFLEI